MRSEYRQLRDQRWGGDGRYDLWMEDPMSNAKLLPFGLYDQWVPAFAQLFEQTGKSWPRFYLQVEQLAELAPAERQRRLQKLGDQQNPNRVAELRCETEPG
jgi:predicted aminopeptidase